MKALYKVEWTGKVQYKKEVGVKGLVPMCEILLRDTERQCANSYLGTLLREDALQSYQKGDIIRAQFIYYVEKKGGKYHQRVLAQNIDNLSINIFENDEIY